MNSTESASKKLFFLKCSTIATVLQDDQTKQWLSPYQKAIIQKAIDCFLVLVDDNKKEVNNV